MLPQQTDQGGATRRHGILGGARPIVVGTRLRSRGTRTFYQVRVPAATRTAADQLCTRIRTAGGACIVLPT